MMAAEQNSELDARIMRAVDSAVKSVQQNKDDNEFVSQFENDLAVFCGVPHAIGTDSAGQAMVAALMAAGVVADDEVIVSPFCGLNTAEALNRVGARVVVTDCDKFGNMSVDSLRSAISVKTVAVV